MYTYKKSTNSQNDVIVKIRSEIQNQEELKLNEKLILSQIIFFEGLGKKEHGASNEYFAKLISKSRQTAARVIKKLEMLGYITVEIVDNYKRIIRLCTEKLSQILIGGYIKMIQGTINLIDETKSNIQSITTKTRTFFKRKDIKDNYKKENKELRKNKITIYQEDNQSREEFDKICDYRESCGEVIDRRYNSSKSNNSISIKDIMIQSYNNFRTKNDVNHKLVARLKV